MYRSQGIIKVHRKLDRETTSVYSLVITAEDKGNTPRTGLGYVSTFAFIDRCRDGFMK